MKKYITTCLHNYFYLFNPRKGHKAVTPILIVTLALLFLNSCTTASVDPQVHEGLPLDNAVSIFTEVETVSPENRLAEHRETATPTPVAALVEEQESDAEIPLLTDIPQQTLTNTPTLRPTNTSTSTPEPQLEVIVNSANLRSGPGTDYDTAGVLKRGDIVQVLAQTSDGSWYTVQLEDGSIGWIALSIAQPVNETYFKAVVIAATIPALPTILPPQPVQEATTQISATQPVATQALATPTPTATQPAATLAPTQLPAAGITLVTLTSPVNPGANATLVVAVAPGATCNPGVIYKSGESTAAGLEAKTAADEGQISWTWKVGTRTTPGTWTVYVNCNPGGYKQWGIVVQ